MLERTRRPAEEVQPQKTEKRSFVGPTANPSPLRALADTVNGETAAAFAAVSTLMAAGDFKGAAAYLSNLAPGIRQRVVARILANAPKPPVLSVTPQDLNAALASAASIFIPPAVLEALKKVKPFKGGGWNPKPGESEGAYIGRGIHDAIATRYRTLHPTDEMVTNSRPLKSIFGRYYPGKAVTQGMTEKQLDLRPDILNITKGHLFEIKPLNDIAGAVLQRELYINTMAAAGITVQAGPSSEPGASGTVAVPSGYALYWSPLPGVIIYRKYNGNFDPAKLPLPGTRMDEETVKDKKPQAKPATPALTPEGAVMADLERATGLTGAALLLYLVVSESARVLFPPRNLIPLP